MLIVGWLPLPHTSVRHMNCANLHLPASGTAATGLPAAAAAVRKYPALHMNMNKSVFLTQKMTFLKHPTQVESNLPERQKRSTGHCWKQLRWFQTYLTIILSSNKSHGKLGITYNILRCRLSLVENYVVSVIISHILREHLRWPLTHLKFFLTLERQLFVSLRQRQKKFNPSKKYQQYSHFEICGCLYLGKFWYQNWVADGPGHLYLTR